MNIMSNFLAIATVTAVIKNILENKLSGAVSGTLKVTTVRPDKLASNGSEKGVNLYLYMVTPNAALRNADLPNRNSEGRLVQRPQVALDLHYLLTFYGDDEALEPQRLLGSLVRTFHTRPILTREMIERAITKYSNSSDPSLYLSFSFVQSSNLCDALETVKITPATLSLEEVSKLWSVFFQTPYRLSVAYVASVVLIESEDVSQSFLPVRDRNLYVMPFHQPVIEKVLSAEGSDKLIVAESKLVIRGKKLRGNITLVKVNEKEIIPESISETQITVSLPSSLSAGVHGLQVVHKMLMGTPQVPHNSVESNLYSFVLHPTITEKITISKIEGSGGDSRSANLTIKIKPDVGMKQRVLLFLNSISSGEKVSYTFIDAARSIDTNTLKMHIEGVKSANYLVRVQVDGAQSQLTLDTDKNSPTFNQYSSPKVEIP